MKNKLLLSALGLIFASPLALADVYSFRVRAVGVQASAPVTPPPVTPPPVTPPPVTPPPVTPPPAASPVGDGISLAGACASGAATGCAVWNSADKGAASTVSGDLMTANFTNVSAVRATKGKADGKWYWEISVGGPSVAPLGGLVAVGTSTLSMTNPFTATPPMWAWYGNSNPGNSKICGGWNGGSQVFKNGDTVGVALDVNARTVTYYLNGAASGVACSNLPASTTFYPVVGTGGVSTALTANFGAANFKYPVPAGFNAGLW